MPITVFEQYDPDILNRKIQQELSIAGAKQKMETDSINNALNQQLQPLRQRAVLADAMKTERELDPNYQAQRLQDKISEAVAVANARKRVQAPTLGKIVVDKASGKIFEILPNGVRERTLGENGVQAPAQPDLTAGDGSDFGDETDTQTQVNNNDGPLVIPGITKGLLTPPAAKAEKTSIQTLIGEDNQPHKFTVNGAGERVKDLGRSGILTPKAGSNGELKPSEKQTALREIRNEYSASPATIEFLGKDQSPGSFQVKDRLDGILSSVGGDFEKLNPQAAATFAVQMNKLNDKNSAVLMSEFQTVGERLGLGDRLSRVVGKTLTGRDITPQVAKDIYSVIQAVENQHKSDFFPILDSITPDLEEIGFDLGRLRLPPRVLKEYEEYRNSQANGGASPAPQAPKASLPSYKSEEEALAAGHKKGERVIIGGQSGTLQ